MRPLLSDCQKFAELVEKHFGFLHEHGFKRTLDYEAASPTSCSVMFLGKHVAIEIYLDIRDNYVGVTVIKVKDGMPKRNLEGGFSADLGSYLRRLGHYQKTPRRHLPSPIEAALASWADHLRLNGKKILADLPDSLPNKSDNISM